MPGLTLGIGETNPKKGAVQWDARRIDGVQFVIPSGAGVISAPVGSVVTLQEDAAGTQRIVLGAAAYAATQYDTYSVISVGFLEAATQADWQVAQTVGAFVSGDIVAMISDVAAVASVPMDGSNNPVAGGTSYITPSGTLSSAASSNVAFPGSVWYGTPGQQTTGQLKSGYIFARLAAVMTGTV